MYVIKLKKLQNSMYSITSFSIFPFLFFFLAIPSGMWNSPDQESNPFPLQWKHGVITTDHQESPTISLYLYTTIAQP